jgi:predicted HicB family RNase H-like nuclease
LNSMGSFPRDPAAGPRPIGHCVGKSQEMCCQFNSTPERSYETMPQLLVRDLDPETVERLKLRARRHGRSLQGEVEAILEAAATFFT